MEYKIYRVKAVCLNPRNNEDHFNDIMPFFKEPTIQGILDWLKFIRPNLNYSNTLSWEFIKEIKE